MIGRQTVWWCDDAGVQWCTTHHIAQESSGGLRSNLVDFEGIHFTHLRTSHTTGTFVRQRSWNASFKLIRNSSNRIETER